MLRLEFQATRASSWYADAEDSFINWEHTRLSPFLFVHQLHVHPRQIISLHVHCQYLSSIRLNIYKLYNCYQALMILAEGCLNCFKKHTKITLIRHTEMTLYQHCWQASFVMLIYRPNIYWLVISDLLNVRPKKNTKKWNFCFLTPCRWFCWHHELSADGVVSILTILLATHNFEI